MKAWVITVIIIVVIFIILFIRALILNRGSGSSGDSVMKKFIDMCCKHRV